MWDVGCASACSRRCRHHACAASWPRMSRPARALAGLCSTPGSCCLDCEPGHRPPRFKTLPSPAPRSHPGHTKQPQACRPASPCSWARPPSPGSAYTRPPPVASSPGAAPWRAAARPWRRLPLVGCLWVWRPRRPGACSRRRHCRRRRCPHVPRTAPRAAAAKKMFQADGTLDEVDPEMAQIIRNEKQRQVRVAAAPPPRAAVAAPARLLGAILGRCESQRSRRVATRRRAPLCAPRRRSRAWS